MTSRGNRCSDIWKYAPAHYGGAVTDALEIGLGYSQDDNASLQSAMALALRAVDLDERNPYAQAVLGKIHYYAGDHGASVETLNRAIALSPNLSYAYYCRAFTLVMWNRPSDALMDLDMAERLSPADPFLWSFYWLRAWASISLGELDDAIVWATKSAALPNSPFLPHLALAIAHQLSGDRNSARQSKDTLLTLQPEFSIAFFDRSVRIADPSAMRPMFDVMVEAVIPEG